MSFLGLMIKNPNTGCDVELNKKELQQLGNMKFEDVYKKN